MTLLSKVYCSQKCLKSKKKIKTSSNCYSRSYMPYILYTVRLRSVHAVEIRSHDQVSFVMDCLARELRFLLITRAATNHLTSSIWSTTRSIDRCIVTYALSNGCCLSRDIQYIFFVSVMTTDCFNTTIYKVVYLI